MDHVMHLATLISLIVIAEGHYIVNGEGLGLHHTTIGLLAEWHYTSYSVAVGGWALTINN